MSTQPPENSGSETSSDSLTEAQLVEQLLGPPQQEQETETVEEVETEEEVEQTDQETEEVEQTETEAEATEDDLIAQLLSSDPERLKEIARLAGSKSLGRFGELTSKIKSLEAQSQSQQAAPKPLPEALPNNPFRGLDAAQLETKRKDLGKVAKTLDEILDDHEDYGPNDTITYDGKDFTKKELKSIRRVVTEQLSDFIPDQQAELQRSEQRAKEKEVYDAAILEQIPALSEEKSELKDLYNGIMADPRTSLIAERVPDLAPQLSFIMAHAANSIFQTMAKPPTKATAPGTKARPRVPASPVGAVAPSSRVEPGVKVKEKADKFYQSGRADDLVAMLTANQS